MPAYDVHRSIEINDTPENVFRTVADYGDWRSWSPWLCAEPNAKVEITEDPSSVGSVYSWKGELVGEGEIEHLALQPGRLIEDEIRFVKPFRSQAKVAFEMEPAGEATKVTWRMRGSLPWFLFWMRPQMEGYIGMDYERGLKMLKERIETGDVLSETNIRGVEPVGPLRVAGVRKTCSLRDIGPSMGAAFTEAREKLPECELPIDGEPVSVYHKFDLKTRTFDYTSGFALPDSAAEPPPRISSWSIPGTKALCVEHIGSYEHLGNAWSAAHQYARYKKLKQSQAGAFEVYKNDPTETQPAELRTEVFLLLK